MYIYKCSYQNEDIYIWIMNISDKTKVYIGSFEYTYSY